MVTSTVTITADGYIHEDGVDTIEVLSDGYVIIPIFDRVAQVLGDGLVAEKYSVFCDAVVTAEAGSGRYVKSHNSSLGSISDWYISSAENVSGTSYAKSSVVVPFEYICTFDNNLTSIAICLNMATNFGDILTITVQEGSTVLGSTTLNSIWTSVGSVSPGWFLVGFTTPIAQVEGHTYKVVITGGEGSGILVTDNAVGAGGIVGRVLNCVVVSDHPAVSFDGRPLMVIPKSQGISLPTLTLSGSSVTTDALYLGVNTTLNLAASEDVTININKLLSLSPYSTLNMIPDTGKKHSINYGLNAGLINYGSINMTGESKTRYAQTIEATTQFSTTITLDQTPNWVSGDRIYIASSDTQMGTVCVVSSVSGPVVTLQSGVGRNNEIGVYVFCLSRWVSMSGYSSSGKAGIALKPYSSLNITSGELKSFNTIFPDPTSTITLSDLVVSDSQVFDYETASVGMRLNVDATDIALIRAGTGLVTQGDITLDGDTIIAGAYTAGVIVKTGSLAADIISTNINVSTINLSGNTSFNGSVINDYAKISLIRVQGIVDDIQLSGRLKTATGQTPSVISLDSASGLNNFYGYQITTDGPYISGNTGSLFVGNARLVECTSTASKLVTGSIFIRLIDEDGIFPVSGFITGTLPSGAEISNRYRTETKTGSHFAFDDPDYGLIMKIQGALHRVELARIAVSTGEVATFSCVSKGAGRFIIESAVAPDVIYEVTNTSFAAQEFETTATADGIIVVSFEADNTASLDRLIRL